MDRAEPISVLIVDDDAVLAEALSMVLQSQPEFRVVGAANAGAAGVELAGREQPTVVLMDFHLPDMTGAEAVKQLNAARPETAVVMLTMDASDETLLAALEAGATGFLLKSRGIGEVVDIVRRAAAKEMLFPAATVARLMGAMREKRRREIEQGALLDQHTAREMDTLRLMAQGCDTKAIADRLVVSTTTVRTHVQNVLTKLGAHSRLEAVARATELGLLKRGE
jgi:DNA-binding NarL/FixJ family response regulator